MQTLTLPDELVQARLYPNRERVIEDALRLLWKERTQLRIDWAIYQYQHEDISLAKAASLAGISFDRLKEILVKRGIQPRLGSETMAEALNELAVLRQTQAKDKQNAIHR